MLRVPLPRLATQVGPLVRRQVPFAPGEAGPDKGRGGLAKPVVEPERAGRAELSDGVEDPGPRGRRERPVRESASAFVVVAVVSASGDVPDEPCQGGGQDVGPRPFLVGAEGLKPAASHPEATVSGVGNAEIACGFFHVPTGHDLDKLDGGESPEGNRRMQDGVRRVSEHHSEPDVRDSLENVLGHVAAFVGLEKQRVATSSAPWSCWPAGELRGHGDIHILRECG